jgi:hypothetical protein
MVATATARCDADDAAVRAAGVPWAVRAWGETVTTIVTAIAIGIVIVIGIAIEATANGK